MCARQDGEKQSNTHQNKREFKTQHSSFFIPNLASIPSKPLRNFQDCRTKSRLVLEDTGDGATETGTSEASTTETSSAAENEVLGNVVDGKVLEVDSAEGGVGEEEDGREAVGNSEALESGVVEALAEEVAGLDEEGVANGERQNVGNAGAEDTDVVVDAEVPDAVAGNIEGKSSNVDTRDERKAAEQATSREEQVLVNGEDLLEHTVDEDGGGELVDAETLSNGLVKRDDVEELSVVDDGEAGVDGKTLDDGSNTDAADSGLDDLDDLETKGGVNEGTGDGSEVVDAEQTSVGEAVVDQAVVEDAVAAEESVVATEEWQNVGESSSVNALEEDSGGNEVLEAREGAVDTGTTAEKLGLVQRHLSDEGLTCGRNDIRRANDLRGNTSEAGGIDAVHVHILATLGGKGRLKSSSCDGISNRASIRHCVGTEG